MPKHDDRKPDDNLTGWQVTVTHTVNGTGTVDTATFQDASFWVDGDKHLNVGGLDNLAVFAAGMWLNAVRTRTPRQTTS